MNLDPIGLRTRAMFARIDEDEAQRAELTDAFYALAKDVLGETHPPVPEFGRDGTTPIVQAEIDGLAFRVKRTIKKDETHYILDVKKMSGWYTVESLPQLARLFDFKPDA